MAKGTYQLSHNWGIGWSLVVGGQEVSESLSFYFPWIFQRRSCKHVGVIVYCATVMMFRVVVLRWYFINCYKTCLVLEDYIQFLRWKESLCYVLLPQKHFFHSTVVSTFWPSIITYTSFSIAFGFRLKFESWAVNHFILTPVIKKGQYQVHRVFTQTEKSSYFS